MKEFPLLLPMSSDIGAMTHSIVTFSIMILSIMVKNATLSIKCLNTECTAFIVMLNVAILSAVVLHD